MIVRISGEGQFDLNDDAVRELDRLDTDLTGAVDAGDDGRFHSLLHETIAMIRERGTLVADDRVVPSDVIVPPEDITLGEARRFFTDEGLMQPLPA